MANKNFWLGYKENNMKRCILFSILLTGLSAGIFAFDFNKLALSVGGGTAIIPYAEGLDITAPGYETAYIKNNWTDWGIFAFFDAEYAEVDVGYFQAFSGNYTQSEFGYPLDLQSNYGDIKVSYLDIGIMLKYPLKFNNNKSVCNFMVGMSYWINIQADYGYEHSVDAFADIKKKDWNQMWIDLGVGIDQYFTEKIYLRFNAGFGVPMATEDWKKRADDIQSFFGNAISGTKDFTPSGRHKDKREI
jgi:hypothetical protein